MFAWQSGHRPLQRGTTYGLDGAFPTLLQPQLLEPYQWASSRWHEFLHLPSKLAPRVDAQEAGHYSPSRPESFKLAGNTYIEEKSQTSGKEALYRAQPNSLGHQIVQRSMISQHTPASERQVKRIREDDDPLTSLPESQDSDQGRTLFLDQQPASVSKRKRIKIDLCLRKEEKSHPVHLRRR